MIRRGARVQISPLDVNEIIEIKPKVSTFEEFIGEVLTLSEVDINLLPRILNMVDINKNKVISKGNAVIIDNVINFIKISSIDIVEAFFNTHVADEGSFWDSSLFAKESDNYKIDMEISLGRDKVETIRCPRCGGNAFAKVKQTRSADEGMTTFIVCNEASCGFKSKT